MSEQLRRPRSRSPETPDQDADRRSCRLFTEEDHGHGFIDERTPELAIAVWDGHLGGGIGSRLLVALEDAARDADINGLSLTVDNENPARRLYLRCGYQPVSSDERACAW